MTVQEFLSQIEGAHWDEEVSANMLMDGKYVDARVDIVDVNNGSVDLFLSVSPK